MKCQRRDRREEGKVPSVDQGLGQDPLQNEELDGQEWRIFNFFAALLDSPHCDSSGQSVK